MVPEYTKIGSISVSLICWALLVYFHQSDMLDFVGYVRQSDMLGFVVVVGLRGGTSVSLICWALLGYVRQSDMLGFMGVLLSV